MIRDAALLSIPAWFDWRPTWERRVTLWEHLSIPAWFDWRLSRSHVARIMRATFNPSLVRLAPRAPWAPRGSRGQLSIPAWFDWRLRMFFLGEFARPAFNPSLVRLARGRSVLV